MSENTGTFCVQDVAYLRYQRRRKPHFIIRYPYSTLPEADSKHQQLSEKASSPGRVFRGRKDIGARLGAKKRGQLGFC